MRKLVVVLLIAASPIALAEEQMPTDADLRSAYCISILQTVVGNVKQLEAQNKALVEASTTTPEVREKVAGQNANIAKARADLEVTLSRLRAYLLPRLFNLDPLGILQAQKPAEADWQRSNAPSECTTECTKPENVDNIQACVDAKCPVERELRERMGSCRNPTWLPF